MGETQDPHVIDDNIGSFIEMKAAINKKITRLLAKGLESLCERHENLHLHVEP